MKIQVNLYIFTIFVDYADFYVNTIMSTSATGSMCSFIIFNYFSRYRTNSGIVTLNIVFASIPACSAHRVNFIYPVRSFVQLNQYGTFGGGFVFLPLP